MLPVSTAPLRKLRSVQFGILSPDEITRYSVTHIDATEYSNSLNSSRSTGGVVLDPSRGSLNDPRLGCMDPSRICYTCEENMHSCPGHFGHITLNAPMYNIGFIRTVKKILECVCPTCARYRIHPDDPKYRVLANVRDKFKCAWEFAKSKTVCEFCETQLLPVRRQGVVLYYDPKKFDAKAARTPITPADALQLLARITDETCNILGLNPVTSRPEWMITTVLPVPPMCVRPSVSIDSAVCAYYQWDLAV
ncbi:DNA-directed RNA polymerase II subunit rpb1 [Chytriomyces hyalinus]|nr:DNA-directed RNA polymerase II subunit rpb1 [Chytriomyces hyalinus]